MNDGPVAPSIARWTLRVYDSKQKTTNVW